MRLRIQTGMFFVTTYPHDNTDSSCRYRSVYLIYLNNLSNYPR